MTLRNGKFCAFALALVLTFAGCQSGPKAEQKDAAADLAAVNALRGKFTAAYNANDAGALAALYADDAIVIPPNQPVIEGRPAIQSMYEGLFKSNAVKLTINPLETQLAGDWAYDRGTATITMTPKGGQPIGESDRYVVVVKRLAGGMWKVYREIANAGAPPPTPAAPAKKAPKKVVKKGGKRR